ncbi:PAS domain S-box protein [Aquabacterium sp. J223]|uniref:PAS domain S-box protein n=1 Tax=Aquabacterium sp. J223 TaxID=2898431 RepID=UPI0021AD66BA|nr:PAS domain S-box protein [Aquabacterium sp. J223]UUX97564.1 PAS domain S-box protein [Aquabacterium sp. J223]
MRFGPLKGSRPGAATATAPGGDTEPPPSLAEGAGRELARLLWQSPFLAVLLDAAQRRCLAANTAFTDWSGYDVEALAAAPPRPPLDRPPATRNEERALVDAHGQERWCRGTELAMTGLKGEALVLVVLQDCTAERVAREQADRSGAELAQWFDLSPLGLVVFDEEGLVLRCNPAFQALVGEAPTVLQAAPPALRELLGWPPSAHDAADAAPRERSASLHLPDGRRLRLRALVRPFAAGGSRRRFMAVVEDRSAEEDRELAALEIGALMDTAAIGVATFEESHGWVTSQAGASARQAPGRGGASGLQAISRELVEPASLPEYERLQQALKSGERAEVRYAVRHPQAGLRWLLTRVEPGQLASGRRTRSVVTLDVTEQEQADARNEQLLRELSTLLDGSAAGIAYLRSGRIERANPALAALTGYAPAELAGLDMAELFDSLAAFARYREQQEPVLARTGRLVEERRLRRRDGSLLWVQVSERLVDENDPAAGVICSFVDIDERQRAREALALQAERNRALLDSVLVGIVTVGEHGIEWMNRSARRMFGGELADFVGEPIATVATPEPNHPLRRTDRFLRLGEGRSESFECRLQGRDGRTFWVVGNAVLTRDAAGQQLTFALLDIERRRQAEVSIAQTQASLQRILETAPLAIGLLEAHSWRVQQINQQAGAFLGTPVGRAVGQPLQRLLEPGFFEQVRQDLEQALEQAPLRGGALVREYPRTSGGRTRIFESRYVALTAADGRAEQLLFVASDVTEQRAAEQARLEAAVAQRDMLVKEVHHRIKNNLQGVAGLMQQLAHRQPAVAPVITEAVGQVQAIAQVYGLQVGAAGPLQATELLQAVSRSVQRVFGREVVVVIEGEAPADWSLPEAEAIPVALTLNELLTNAIKHGPGTAPVRCRLLSEPQRLTLEVRNPGTLPDGFAIGVLRGGVSGLGLVRALLPRRHATLSLEADGGDVCARVVLLPPSVRRAAPGRTQELPTPPAGRLTDNSAIDERRREG